MAAAGLGSPSHSPGPVHTRTGASAWWKWVLAAAVAVVVLSTHRDTTPTHRTTRAHPIFAAHADTTADGHGGVPAVTGGVGRGNSASEEPKVHFVTEGSDAEADGHRLHVLRFTAHAGRAMLTYRAALEHIRDDDVTAAALVQTLAVRTIG